MHVFANDVVEWFVAASVEDAKTAAKEFWDSNGITYEDEHLEFGQVPDQKVLEMTTGYDERGRSITARKTAAEWANSSPRGFLMTTEY